MGTFSVVNGKVMRAGATARVEVPPTETARLLEEMLGTLRELVADKYLSDPINADRMARARAAIAKAEGCL